MFVLITKRKNKYLSLILCAVLCWWWWLVVGECSSLICCCLFIFFLFVSFALRSKSCPFFFLSFYIKLSCRTNRNTVEQNETKKTHRTIEMIVVAGCDCNYTHTIFFLHFVGFCVTSHDLHFILLFFYCRPLAFFTLSYFFFHLGTDSLFSV